MTAEIKDRRWRWEYLTVSGRWNRRGVAGIIDEDTKKTWQELFDEIFEAAGEEVGTWKVDLGDNLGDPHSVDWDATRVDIAMEELLERAACVLSLRLNNQFLVEPNGNGPDHPWTEHQKVPVVNLKSEQAPRDIHIKCEPTVYQCWVELEPVVFDYNGNAVHPSEAEWIDDWEEYRRSHAPGMIGWSQGYGSWWGVRPDTYRKYSGRIYWSNVEHLYRVFRVKKLAYEDSKYGDKTLPDGNKYETPNDLLRIQALICQPTFTSMATRISTVKSQMLLTCQRRLHTLSRAWRSTKSNRL
jgi:hypothetical protein